MKATQSSSTLLSSPTASIGAVVDIGSNSIKLLVARGENVEPIFEDFREVRLSPTSESERERIPEDVFNAGIRAVRELAEKARTFSPAREFIVATSLFRTAENAREFADAVFATTGTPMRILSGEEEARFIAAGVATDPAISHPDFIFDLGGGSLEIITQNRETPESVDEKSFPLGAVRLARKFFKNPLERISTEELSALRSAVRESLCDALPPNVPADTQAVFCGGAATIIKRLSGEGSSVSATTLDTLLGKLCATSVDERIALGVPAKRADIFPASVAVFAELCAFSKITALTYTARNLRYGILSTQPDA